MRLRKDIVDTWTYTTNPRVRCPGCGGEWIQGGEAYRFRCATCRLHWWVWFPTDLEDKSRMRLEVTGCG